MKHRSIATVWAGVWAVLFFAIVSLFSGCALVPDPRPTDRVVVASWNVENLFDEYSQDEYALPNPGRTFYLGFRWRR